MTAGADSAVDSRPQQVRRRNCPRPQPDLASALEVPALDPAPLPRRLRRPSRRRRYDRRRGLPYRCTASSSRRRARIFDTLAAGRRRLDEGENVAEDIERAAHTLAGIAGTVKFDAMKDVGHALEGLLERLLGKPADAPARALIGDAIERLEAMLTSATARQLPDAVPELIARLDGLGVGEADAEAAPLDFTAPAAPPETLTATSAAADLDFALLETAPVDLPPAAADLDFARSRR
jgi:HPt (histidine-containing phosphotransfer) domain-containing protein